MLRAKQAHNLKQCYANTENLEVNAELEVGHGFGFTDLDTGSSLDLVDLDRCVYLPNKPEASTEAKCPG